MTQETQNMTPEAWAEKLARGDGQGMVPVDAARAMHERGLLTCDPQPRRPSDTHVMVRLAA